jgi:diguanylate cyclase (GGDEF)-like protein
MAAGALTTAQNGPVVILGGRTFGDLHRSGSAPGLPVQAYGRSGGLTALRVNVREGSNDWAPLIVPGLGVLMCLVVLALAQQLALSPVDRVMAVIGLMAGLARGVQMVKPDRPPEDGHQQARIDDLTGLANRRAMYEQVESVLRDSGPRHPICFLILDLDRFKEVNDALGHAAGDVLLAHVGRRLGRLVRPGDLAARLGGDEFAMLMPGASQEEAEQMARHVVETLGKPFRIGATTLHTAASVGIVASPPATRDRSELVRCADVAMYQAKRGGLGISTYSRSADHPDRLRTVEELREALRGSGEGDSGEIVVHFQPQVLLTTGEVCGAEALVRWIHPQRGTIYPGDFLPLAKASGLMDLVTEVVCDLAIGACARWWNTGLRIPVSINLPGGAVHDLALVERINVTLAKHGLPAQAITVEITEDTLMNDPPMARKVLQQLRDLGASVAIDDYGTGYSSLAYLRNLPVDELKLDKAFLNEIFDEPRAQAIVHHVIDLAHALGMRLVAEGIDDPAIAGLLAEYGCDIGQGYLFARSMPWDQWVIWAQTEGSRMREILADTNPEPVGRRSARRSAGVPVPRSEPAPVSQTQVEYPR